MLHSLPPILVVDDCEDDLHVFRRRLAKAKITNPIVTFSDATGVMAFLKAAAGAPDSGLMPYLVFTDLKMPGVGGLDLLKWIRGQRAFRHLPVVMVSGSGAEADIASAHALGVNKYLTKLPEPEELTKVVSDVGRWQGK